MRHTPTVLRWLAIALVGFLGCKTQPELKPEPKPEVLASPGLNDKRYDKPCCYPPDVLANDPIKRSMKDEGLLPAAGTRSPGMPGMPSAGVGPRGY
jgi:hypothetical protein